MKQEPGKLPGELFFDGHGCGPRLLGLLVGLINPIVIHGVTTGWDFRWVYDLLRHDPLFGSIFIFGPFFGFLFLTFRVHQVRINVRARTYSLQRGFWPFYRTFIGTLDGVEIHLTTVYARGSLRVPVVSPMVRIRADLVWKDSGQPNLLLWSEDAHNSKIPEAEARARDLAAHLQVPVRIELGSREIKRDIPRNAN